MTRLTALAVILVLIGCDNLPFMRTRCERAAEKLCHAHSEGYCDWHMRNEQEECMAFALKRHAHRRCLAEVNLACEVGQPLPERWHFDPSNY